MDFIYSKIDNSLISDNADVVVTWQDVAKQLPNPAIEYYMKVVVVKVNKYEMSYLCIKKDNKFIWKLIATSKKKLDTPTIILPEGDSIVRWGAITDAEDYHVFANDKYIGSTPNTLFDLRNVLVEDGVYRIQVVAHATEAIDSNKSNYVDYIVLTVVVDGGLIS